MEYLYYLSFVLLFGSAFGLIVLVFGYIFEKVVEKTIGMEKFVNIMFSFENDEDEEDEY